MSGSLRRCGLALVALAGCKGGGATADAGDPDAPTDARIPQSCKLPAPPLPTGGGTVELGSVDPPDLNNFTVVKQNDLYQSYAGPQGGYHLWIDTRIKGMDLGDGSVSSRPLTKFNIYMEDGRRINLEDCAYHLAYHDGGDGQSYLSVGWLNQILNSVGGTLDHTPLRLKVEVLDRNGVYAIDERMISALAPIPTPIGP